MNVKCMMLKSFDFNANLHLPVSMNLQCPPTQHRPSLMMNMIYREMLVMNKFQTTVDSDSFCERVNQVKVTYRILA